MQSDETRTRPNLMLLMHVVLTLQIQGLGIR